MGNPDRICFLRELKILPSNPVAEKMHCECLPIKTSDWFLKTSAAENLQKPSKDNRTLSPSVII